MTMTTATVFGAEWEAMMAKADAAYAEYAKVDADARKTMANSKSVAETNAALDLMSKSSDSAEAVWVEANPIRYARNKRDYSVPRLARLIGLSQPALFSWEHGNVANPDAEGMEKIAAQLGEPELGKLWRQWRDIPRTYGYK